MKNRENTIIFINEIQVYPHLLSLLKPLRYDNKFKYIYNRSLLGVPLRKSNHILMGSIIENKCIQWILKNSYGRIQLVN